MATSVTPDPLEDPRVFRAMQEYQTELDAGRAPDRAALCARHPEVADVLAGCLRGLDLLHEASPLRCEGAGPVQEFETQFNDFRILREVGRGGMGAVYEAEQISLGRRVAVKVLLASSLDERARLRFRNEAHAAASLQHPHIVPVHAIGTQGDTLFLAMRFIEGRSLSSWIREWNRSAEAGMETSSPSDTDASGDPCPIPREPRSEYFRAAAKLIAQTSDAIHHAHGLGIIHRDVKPGNLLLEADGHPWVVDFGLAHRIGDPGLTRTGEMVGTLRYMSPEQASSDVAVDLRTDVYSLGATLYELLALRPAFPGSDPRDVLRRVLNEAPPRLAGLVPDVPRELAVIVDKAMAKLPGDRYSTAADLRDDLQRFLDDRPILAKPPTGLQRTRKWLRRHRTLVRVTVAAAFVLLAMTAGGVAIGARRISDEKRNADKLNGELIVALDRITEQKRTVDSLNGDLQTAVDLRDRALASANFQLARKDWLASDFARAVTHLDQCPPHLRAWEWQYLDALCRNSAWQADVGGSVLALAADPTSSRIAVCGQDYANQQGTFCCYDTAVADPNKALLWKQRAVPIRTMPARIAFSADGARLAVARREANLVRFSLLDASTGDVISHFSLDDGLRAELWATPDGGFLAATDKRGDLTVWDVDRKAVRNRFKVERGEALATTWSPDGRWLALGHEGSVDVVESATGRQIALLPSPGRTTAIAFSRDGRRLAVASGNFGIRIWDLVAVKELTHLPLHELHVSGLVFSPDGGRLVSCAREGLVNLWDWERGVELAVHRGHAGLVCAAVFVGDGTQFVSGDRTLRCWSIHDESEGSGSPPHDGARRFVISPDGELIAGARAEDRPSPDRPPFVFLRETRTGRERAIVHQGLEGPAYMAFSQNGKRLALAGKDSVLRIWNLDLAKIECEWNVAEHAEILRFSHDGSRLAVACLKSIRVFSVPDGKCLRTIEGSFALNEAVDFDKDGRLAYPLGGAQVAILVVDSGEIVHRLKVSGPAWSVRFSLDGRMLAVTGTDGRVHIWDPSTGRELRHFTAHSVVRSLAFTPDGSRLATSGMDKVSGVIRIWDPNTGEECLSIVTRHPLRALSFIPQGLVASGYDKLLLWKNQAVRVEPFRFDEASYLPEWHRAGARPLRRDSSFALWHAERWVALDPTAGEEGRNWLRIAALNAARDHAMIGSWHRARALLAQSVQLGTDPGDLDSYDWQPAWIALFLAGAQERRRFATDLVARHRDSKRSRSLQLAARLPALLSDSLADPSSTLPLAKRAVALEVKNPYLWVTQALCQIRANDPAAATESISQAVSLRPALNDDWEVELLRCLIALKSSTREEASRRYTRVVKLIDANSNRGIGTEAWREELRGLRLEIEVALAEKN